MASQSWVNCVHPQVPLKEWASFHMELLWIYDHKVPQKYLDWEVRGQRRFYRAWLIRDGSVRITQPGHGIADASEGFWIFPPRGDFHQRFTRDAQILSINFLCEWPSGEGLLQSNGSVVIENAKFPELELRAHQLELAVRRHFPEADTRYYEKPLDCGHFLSFHALFLNWLSAWLEVQSLSGTTFTRLAAGDDRVVRAIRCLNTSELRGGYPREALFQQTDLSEAHLNRLFVAECGITTRRSWENRRLAEARRCLETSRLPIKEIAYRLGFRADAHFTTWFRKLTGERPSQYRKINQTAPI